MANSDNIKSQEIHVANEHSNRLQFLWGKLINAVHLIITLCAGTLLIFFNSIKLSEFHNYSANVYMFLSIVFASLALIFSIVWRFVAQHFMEIEVLGNSENIKKYFEESKLYYVTTSFMNKKVNKFYKYLYKIVPFLALFSLLVAWILTMLFILINYNNT